ncbi:hypothetical protein SAMN02799630_05386 [Paenibacillus sp. UNCCL117]|uniref:hypothetical protein n=1 Tax=unclassified Paenibacillus TaxID=185978 RepID=UPI000883B37A|nr:MULTISPECIES: hypothetical protein [unclassified Paenibacillus]SDE41316.1 hypothetical protein SAMN04488602_12755 [Paenibacillus sp. cl123]SFW65465.1 hypothetical protein SAMN02799630_05386 [Paenibacillus sp. UNCCL117]
MPRDRISRKPSALIGLAAAAAAILLWTILTFYNPYSGRLEADSALITFFLLLLPACLVIPSAWLSARKWMALALIWSLPVSLYLALTPGIFAWFGVCWLLYLTAFLLMRAGK